MSLRIALCFLFSLGFSVYAWRNWFVSLCAALLLMAVLQHPDMPKSIANIQGLNLWNILMGNVLLAWLASPRKEGALREMPQVVKLLASSYFLVVIVSFLRLLFSPKDWGETSFGFIISEYLINSIKWVLPGFILFDACRTRRRVTIALLTILGLYFLLSLQVIRWMPLGYATSGSELSARASKIIQNEIGYNRVTLSMMLGGACWAVLATLVICSKLWQRLALLGAASTVALGQALTGGRTGYASWAAVGVILCVVRWRRMLLLIPVAVIVTMVLLPGVRERMFQGFGGKRGNVIIQSDNSEITSGRTVAWPYVIEKIKKAPILGYGRLAMVTTGITDFLLEEFDEAFPHPHQAYLEMILDNGIVGFLGVIPFYFVALWYSFRLLLDRQDSLACAVGGLACSLILALLIGSFGGQTFYPREGAVGLWAAFGLMFRLAVERARTKPLGIPAFSDDPTAAVA